MDQDSTLGTKVVRFGPGDIVLDGDPSPLHAKGHNSSPLFGPLLCPHPLWPTFYPSSVLSTIGSVRRAAVVAILSDNNCHPTSRPGFCVTSVYSYIQSCKVQNSLHTVFKECYNCCSVRTCGCQRGTQSSNVRHQWEVYYRVWWTMLVIKSSRRQQRPGLMETEQQLFSLQGTRQPVVGGGSWCSSRCCRSTLYQQRRPLW